MFNVFKGLKIQGITLLPGVNCPIGGRLQSGENGTCRGGIWYAEYPGLPRVDSYVGRTTTGWWSTGVRSSGPVAEVCRLAGPSALAANSTWRLLPRTSDAKNLYLSSRDCLSPQTHTDPVQHSAHGHGPRAEQQMERRSPAPPWDSTVLSGPNEPASIRCATPCRAYPGGDGKVTWDVLGGPNTETTRSGRNGFAAVKRRRLVFWIVPSLKCDANGDELVTQADLNLIRAGQRTKWRQEPSVSTRRK